MLDTNAVIATLKNKTRFLARLKQSSPEEYGISAIVLYELYYGAFNSQRVAFNLEVLETLQLEVLDFDREDARCAGEVRAVLRAGGSPIGPYDVLIAGQALARDLTLVTHNTQEFERVPGLRIVDWE